MTVHQVDECEVAGSGMASPAGGMRWHDQIPQPKNFVHQVELDKSSSEHGQGGADQHHGERPHERAADSTLIVCPHLFHQSVHVGLTSENSSPAKPSVPVYQKVDRWRRRASMLLPQFQCKELRGKLWNWIQAAVQGFFFFFNKITNMVWISIVNRS